MKYITIRESDNATDLKILKDKLKAEGIDCRLKSEMPDQVINVVPKPLEELQVAEPDFEKATKVLRDKP